MEELTEARIASLRERLDALEAELTESLSRTRDDARPVDLDLPIGRVSRIDAIAQQSMSVANRRRSEVRLQQVAAARMRMASGEYGWCAVCDDPIAFDRLQARPEAPLCMACQVEFEG